jgi:RHS repeat-associated protein
MYDGHGNVVRTIDTSFGLSTYQWRGVWGERQTPALQTGKGYCANLGHQEDETGFIYMRARYYEPTTGRFISEDPARDGVNWYLYADGNPVNRVDFTGKSPLAALVMIGAALLGFIFGMFAGYLFGVHLGQKTDPSFDGGPRGAMFTTIGERLFTLLGIGEASILTWMHFKKIPFGTPLLRLGIAGTIGFIFGFAFGVLLAHLDFEEHVQYREESMRLQER